MRFKKPKNGHFFYYCYECRYWQYLKSVGVAHIGVCRAIKDEPTEADAYDKPCGLFTKKGGRKHGDSEI